MYKLHPAIKWIFRFRAYFTLGYLLLFIFIFIFFLSIGFVPLVSISDNILLTIIGLAFTYIILVLSLGEIYARMAYNRWKYELTEFGVKIERGIIWKKYTSIPYERVQNIEISRGIIARIFGFSIVDIETAGQSGFGYHYYPYRRGILFRRHRRYMAEGHLPAVEIERAEEIRKFIAQKIKGKREQGL